MACTAICAIVIGPQPIGAQGSTASDDFHSYCASCHGEGGKGDGPLARSLRKRPADLTQLARKSGGAFPRDIVFRTIDGRKPVAGHGGPDMPIWGDAFARSSRNADDAAVSARIEALVAYLETIQDKS
jgi:mono/diheme cytochrome c family protein